MPLALRCILCYYELHTSVIDEEIEEGDSMRKGNLLIVHGGAPTAVMNASLLGAIQVADDCAQVERVLGADGGMNGLLKEQFIDISQLTTIDRKRLLITPGTVIGTSRTPLVQEDYERVAQIALRHNIRWILCNGGNGTMDACGRLHDACARYDICVVGIPKTIDNDIAVTDHAPGFGSAARYLAATVSEVAQDVHALPLHVCILEAMGRNAGWLAAASSIAAEYGYGPDLIYLPERAFDKAKFIADIERVYTQQGYAVVVVSEGLRDGNGVPIVEPIFRTERAVYYGDVAAHLAGVVIQTLGIKARSEKPGICGRSSYAHQSILDRKEAIACGAHAAKLALSGRSGVMVTLQRPVGEYHMQLGETELHNVMLKERKMPDAWINADGNGVTDDFRDWCRPLIGGELPRFLCLERQL